jgi:acyl-CoA oxidase
LNPLIKKLENWEFNGQFMLTELGHGLDAINMETTATFSVFPDGSKGFVLHTPNQAAQKWMPPSTPMGKIAKVALVHAKLIVGGDFKGIRMFIVPLTDGIEMCEGLSSK